MEQRIDNLYQRECEDMIDIVTSLDERKAIGHFRDDLQGNTDNTSVAVFPTPAYSFAQPPLMFIQGEQKLSIVML